MTKPRVLVTGGAGYIGSHACKALSAAGYIPVAYDNLVHGHEWAVKWGPLERGDVLDRDRLGEVFSTYQPESVLHFAAYGYVDESTSDPGKYYRNNVSGGLTLLESMRDHGVHRRCPGGFEEPEREPSGERRVFEVRLVDGARVIDEDGLHGGGPPDVHAFQCDDLDASKRPKLRAT